MKASVGLITYMRTDSLYLAADAISELRDVIARDLRPERIAREAEFLQAKSKNAQEAHEAIRPTSALHTAGGRRRHSSTTISASFTT